MNKIFQFVVLLKLVFIDRSDSKQEVLLDTRDALSDLGFHVQQHSQWQEMTIPRDGKDFRAFVVCKVKKKNNNNWIRTPYIKVRGAQRIYVEIEFVMRSCDGVENVASCKETFNLFYYESDRDDATSTHPPWNENSYIKVDTIAADKRWNKNEEGNLEENLKHLYNLEVRGIGPITKNGVYLALQDTGSCISINYIKVYYEYCGVTVKNLATFDKTTTGPDLTSLEESKGQCVANAVLKDYNNHPSLYCDGRGEWTMAQGFCFCYAGFQPDSTLTRCIACPKDSYKSEISNNGCMRCPAYSIAESTGMIECTCMSGFYRAASLFSSDKQCSKPPGKPTSISVNLNDTSATINWNPPYLFSEDNYQLYFNIKCQYEANGNLRQCDTNINYTPSQNNIASNRVKMENLLPNTKYNVTIFAINDITNVAYKFGDRVDNSNFVSFKTKNTAVYKFLKDDVSSNSISISWLPLNLIYHTYQVILVERNSVVQTKTTKSNKITFDGLSAATDYMIKVRTKQAKGYGKFSEEYKFTTLDKNNIISNNNHEKDEVNENEKHIDTVMLIVIGMAVLITIIFVIIVYALRRSRSKRLKKTSNVANLGKSAEKQPFFNGSSIVFGFPKMYIDPTTYEDPNRAVMDFTKEIDVSFVQIQEIIGGGEFGDVCRGIIKIPGRMEEDVALKTLKSGYNTQQKLDFLSEASIMGQFDHPNVIRLEGVVTKGRPLMIITEFMENGSLDNFLRTHDSQFNSIQLVNMLRNVSSGMKYLSEIGYVHRDLAARNILVNAQLVCKVSDFGMSRVLEDETGNYHSKKKGGKIPIRWTAPEAFTYGKFTCSSDVWSFGIVMWEVFSYGERPYWGMSNRDVMDAVKTEYRLPAPMDCPLILHTLMMDCWKKERNQRPKFAELVNALDRLMREPSQLNRKANNESRRTDKQMFDGQLTEDSNLFSMKKQPSQCFSSKNFKTVASDSGFNECQQNHEHMVNNDKVTQKTRKYSNSMDFLNKSAEEQPKPTCVHGRSASEVIAHENRPSYMEPQFFAQDHLNTQQNNQYAHEIDESQSVVVGYDQCRTLHSLETSGTPLLQECCDDATLPPYSKNS